MDRSALVALVAQVVAPLDLEVDRAEVRRAGNRQVIRVFLDGDGPAGVGPDLDQIAEATKAISSVLDGADMGSQPYVLEVSSRGVDAPLSTVAQFRRNRGHLVSISGNDGRHVTGRIVGAQGDVVDVLVDGQRETWAIESIARAVVQVEFSRPEEEE